MPNFKNGRPGLARQSCPISFRQILAKMTDTASINDVGSLQSLTGSWTQHLPTRGLERARSFGAGSSGNVFCGGCNRHRQPL